MGYAEGRVLFRSKAIRGAGGGSRDLQRKSDCVFPATKDVTLLQKRPCHGDSGARSRTGLPTTIFAAISMLAFARVGGRTLPLDLAPEATGVGVGGRIG